MAVRGRRKPVNGRPSPPLPLRVRQRMALGSHEQSLALGGLRQTLRDRPQLLRGACGGMLGEG